MTHGESYHNRSEITTWMEYNMITKKAKSNATFLR